LHSKRRQAGKRTKFFAMLATMGKNAFGVVLKLYSKREKKAAAERLLGSSVSIAQPGHLAWATGAQQATAAVVRLQEQLKEKETDLKEKEKDLKEKEKDLKEKEKDLKEKDDQISKLEVEHAGEVAKLQAEIARLGGTGS
jgi:chromosome segregation ATPase